MDMLKPFLIPISGLNFGSHQFDFQIDASFFQHFENSPIAAGNIEMSMDLDKQPEMMVLQFDFSGTVATACDRCLAAINLPIQGNYPLIVKYGGIEKEDEAELIYINRDDSILDVSKYVYEFICLSLPLIKVYDCDEEDPIPCDEAMLDRMDQAEEEASSGTGNNPFGDALKDLN